VNGPAIPVPTIPAAALRELLAGAPPALWILDTRSREDFERGHLPGSLHCPVHELSRRARELPPRAHTVVVVGEAGARGRAGAVFLLLDGHGSVLLLEGGFDAWDGPVESGPGRPLSAAHPPRPPGWTDPPKVGPAAPSA
jgi:rhodanese-related sulfurtransferase